VGQRQIVDSILTALEVTREEEAVFESLAKAAFKKSPSSGPLKTLSKV